MTQTWGFTAHKEQKVHTVIKCCYGKCARCSCTNISPCMWLHRGEQWLILCPCEHFLSWPQPIAYTYARSPERSLDLQKNEKAAASARQKYSFCAHIDCGSSRTVTRALSMLWGEGAEGGQQPSSRTTGRRGKHPQVGPVFPTWHHTTWTGLFQRPSKTA